jgi:plasmid maintenance system antidote protein VapI
MPCRKPFAVGEILTGIFVPFIELNQSGLAVALRGVVNHNPIGEAVMKLSV